MLSRRQTDALALIMLVILVTGAAALGLVLVHTGARGDVFGRWLRDWGIASLISVPTAFLVEPVVRRVASALAGR